MHKRITRLRELAAQAKPLVPAVVQRQQQRFLDRWNEALQNAGAGGSVSADALRDRALNEAAAYALRIDVAEELARLSAHLDEIDRLLKAGGELGKRLDFLIQELLREANTLGSKSAALELTSIAVEMKVAIEQMMSIVGVDKVVLAKRQVKLEAQLEAERKLLDGKAKTLDEQIEAQMAAMQAPEPEPEAPAAPKVTTTAAERKAAREARLAAKATA